MRKVVALLALLALLAGGAAALRLSSSLGSQMVLQRAPARARLWGTASTAGARLVGVEGRREDSGVATFGVTAPVDAATGAWAVLLPAMPAEPGVSYVLDVFEANTTDQRVLLRGVVFGDVWLCAGQSNMEMTVAQCFDADKEIEDSINYPDIRVFSVQRNAQTAPVDDVVSRNPIGWGPASPATIGAGSWEYFSAACYYFGRTLNRETGVPQGLVLSAWSGTRIQAWMREEAQTPCAATAPPLRTEPTDPQAPAALWNGMVVPLLKMVFVGVHWYQASANTHEPRLYQCLFPLLIDDWRAQFAAPLYFYFTQLGPYASAGMLPAIREAQQSGLTRANTGRGVILDLYDPDSPDGAIHARQKQQIGYRAALYALEQRYGRKDVDALGPVLQNVSIGDTAVVVTLGSASAASVVFTGIQFCTRCCAPGETSFEVRTAATGAWTRATEASVAGLTVTVRVPDAAVGAVDALRYAWQDVNECILVDPRGLPLPPFNTALNDGK